MEQRFLARHELRTSSACHRKYVKGTGCPALVSSGYSSHSGSHRMAGLALGVSNRSLRTEPGGWQVTVLRHDDANAAGSSSSPAAGLGVDAVPATLWKAEPRHVLLPRPP